MHDGYADAYIETYTGRRFYLNAPMPDFCIRDIAHALAHQCRYTGHTRRFYSVAEHSILVSLLCRRPLEGLLHDATEAYLTDVARPIKGLLSGYKEMENELYGKLAHFFGLPGYIHPDTKRADNLALFAEAYCLMPSRGNNYVGIEKYGWIRGQIHIPVLSAAAAEQAFLYMFDSLNSGRGVDESVASHWILGPHRAAI